MEKYQHQSPEREGTHSKWETVIVNRVYIDRVFNERDK